MTPSDYQRKEWENRGRLEPQDVTNMSAQLDEEEEINVAQQAALNRLQGEFYHDFTKDPDGDLPATADSGQPWVIASAGGVTVPQIEDGKLVDPSTENGVDASYAQAQLTGDVTYAEADIELVGGSTDYAAIGVICMSGTIGSGPGGAVPRSGAHVIFTSHDVQWGVWDGDGTPMRLVTAAGGGASPTYPDIRDTGRRHVEWCIDRATNTGYARGPDGKVHRFVDDLIGEAGITDWVWVEPYYGNASTDARIGFYNVAASTAPVDSPGVLATKARLLIQDYYAQNPPRHWVKVSDTVTNYTVPSDNNAVVVTNAAIAETVFAPPSGTIIVDVEGWADVSSIGDAVNLYLACYLSHTTDNRTLFELVRLGGNSSDVMGHLRAKFVFTDMIPDAAYVISPGLFSSKAGAVAVTNPGSHIRWITEVRAL